MAPLRGNISSGRVWFAASAIALVATFARGGDPGTPQDNQQPLLPDIQLLGPEGSQAGFYYEQVDSAPDVYSVTFPENGQTVLVADSFLALIIQSDMGADTQVKELQSYPDMSAESFDRIMDSTFPDQSQTFPLPFTAMEADGTDGSFITLEQDALASPYIRVTVRDTNGKMDTFSLSRLFVDNLLAQEDIEADTLLFAATSFPFRLPETSRPGFPYLSREQLVDIVLQSPELQRQEIIRMPRFFREEATDILKEISNRPPRNTDLVVTNNISPPHTPKKQPNLHKSVKEQAVSLANNDPKSLPPPVGNTSYLRWLAISGWLVAGAALIWAMINRKR